MEREVLIKMARTLNENGIRWAIGASVMLHFHGLVKKPDDIDIIVHVEDVPKAHELLKDMGEYSQMPYTAPFKTKYFLNYKIDNTMIDLMGDFKIENSEGVYTMILDSEAVQGQYDYHGVMIPLTTVEDWFVLYQLIPGREKKVKMIEDYIKERGIEHRNLLERALKQPIPEHIYERIKNILER